MIRTATVAAILCLLAAAPVFAVTAIDPAPVSAIRVTGPAPASLPETSAGRSEASFGEIAAALLGLGIVVVAFGAGRTPRSVSA